MKILPILRRPTNSIPLSYEKFLSNSFNVKYKESNLDSNQQQQPIKSIFGDLNTGSPLGKQQSNQSPFGSLSNNVPKDINFNLNHIPHSNDGSATVEQRGNNGVLLKGVLNDKPANNLIKSYRNDLDPSNYVTRISDNRLNNDNTVIESICYTKDGDNGLTKYPRNETSDITTDVVSYKRAEGRDVFAGRYSHLRVYRNESVDSIVNRGIGVSEGINSLIKERALRGLSKECLEILSEMKKRGIEVSTETYNNCILSCAKTRNAKLARYLFLCLRSDLITPDLKTYTLMIKTHINCGDTSSAFSIYRKMEKEGTRADLVVFSSLIDCLVESKQVSGAWRLFNYMRTWRLIEPDEVLFTIMIKSCSVSRDAEKALSLYQEMLSLNLYPTIHTYTELIRCLSKRKEYFHECFQFYNKIKSQEYTIDAEIMSHLLEWLFSGGGGNTISNTASITMISCCTVGNVRRARELLLEASRIGVEPTLEMYNTYIKTLARQMKLNKMSENEKINHIQKTWEIAKAILSKYMAGSGSSTSIGVSDVDPSGSDYGDISSTISTSTTNSANATSSANKEVTRLLNSVILVYESGCYHDYALEVLKCFPRFNAHPDYMTYFILLRMVGPGMKDVGRFFALWDEAKSHITPQKTLLYMALDMAILSRSAKKTLEILNDMYNAKVFPTPSLMKRLYESGKRITQIHMMINNLVTLQRKLTYHEKLNENKMLQTYIDENELNKSVTTFGSRLRWPFKLMLVWTGSLRYVLRCRDENSLSRKFHEKLRKFSNKTEGKDQRK
ncbi:pentatricopeptide repeat containing protein [Theileria orientalis strain Shintoku]|uniref:Pentatricopeptide repeat containing protein n=1 Tax=Theileria orientalis strain Shintoku TaxID=869250 RepID=J4CD57_THEOR|nr:pentatricopeptide repeat containing protein [Theileria orientalis strain Shintoku]BAM40562.1 pentatricopeptide repeat containing protein [Theileria orientalis strain Shintoku]|eukprot:XP_009690863.1 pentatricopeptide repeat containing protein [Theileria orientalis strain Shintoku]